MKQPKKAETTVVVAKPDVNIEKRKAVQAAIDAVRKQYGVGSVMLLGGQPVAKVPVIPSGCLALDRALGIGGMPRGRVVEIFGPESSGKTTMALSVIAEAQKLGGIAAFVDAEHALDLNLAKNLGVDVDALLFSQPEYGEQALEIVETFVRSGGIDVIVVDSVAALTPKAEIEGDMGDSSMGVQARLMSQAMRKLTSVVATSGTLLIFINQLRMKIGVMYGNPETTTGGQALKFYASVRLDVRIKERIKEGDVVIGNHLRLKVVKNKLAPPFREAEVDLIYGKGIDQLSDLIEVGMSLGIIERSGAWYSFDGERIGQGREAAGETLKNDAGLLLKLKTKVTQAMFVKEPPVVPVASSEEETGA